MHMHMHPSANHSQIHLVQCLQIFTSGRLDVYLLVPMLWAVYNAIPPVLFFVYFFTKGRLLKGLCSFAQVFGLVLAAGKHHFMC
jgi:hypothetical protein